MSLSKFHSSDTAHKAGETAFYNGTDCFAPETYRTSDNLLNAWLKGWKSAYKASIRA